MAHLLFHFLFSASEWCPLVDASIAGERLTHCPLCTSPSRVSASRAECSSSKCSFVFCPDCLCEHHEGRSVVQTRLLYSSILSSYADLAGFSTIIWQNWPTASFINCPPFRGCRLTRTGSKVPKSGAVTSKKSKARLRRLWPRLLATSAVVIVAKWAKAWHCYTNIWETKTGGHSYYMWTNSPIAGNYRCLFHVLQCPWGWIVAKI